MSRNLVVSGGQVGQTLEVKINFTGTDCVPGDKWILNAAGVTFTPATAQAIPAAAISDTLTWKSTAPLPIGIASLLNLELQKEHGTGAGPTWVQTVPVTIVPAPVAPPTAVNANVKGDGRRTITAISWFFLFASIGAFLCGIGLVVYLLWIFAGQASAGFKGQNATNVPEGYSIVVTTVEQKVISDDPVVLKEADHASVRISH